VEAAAELVAAVTPIQKKLLEMWAVWIDGRHCTTGDDPDAEDDEDTTPADVLEYLSNTGLPTNVGNMMRDIAMEYGYVMREIE
jgi:hypothetical protein